MFERFTADARAIVVAAHAEARRLHHDFIGTEHTLIALLDMPGSGVRQALADEGIDPDSVRADIIRQIGPRPPESSTATIEEEDAEALKAIGIDLAEVRRAIEATFGEGALRLPPAGASRKRGLFGWFSPGDGHIPFTRRNKKVLELALREAVRLEQKFIAPEHIMLGLLREGHGLAVQMLADNGVDQGRLRAQMTAALRTRYP